MIIVGTGSGNSILTPDYADWKVAVVERGAFGGTCLNRGCIPSKMFVYASDVAENTRHSAKFGVDAHVDGIRWPEIVDRVFGRIDAIAEGGRDWRIGDENPNVTVYLEDARFVGPKQLQVGEDTITAPIIVLAAGARPFVPDVPGLTDGPDRVAFNTSADIMRIDEVPERLIILGGGFIACEMAHIFGGLGSEITMINRSGKLLRAEDEAISAAFTTAYQERFTLLGGKAIEKVTEIDGNFTVHLAGGETVTGDRVLVATGRIPNGSQLGVDKSGVEMDDAGYVVTDQHLRTNVDGIWALGDITTKYQLKHTANAETRVAAHNIIEVSNGGSDLHTVDYSGVPSAVFAHPQVASVGKTEQELREAGVDYITATKEYGATAYGWAMMDETSFCKVIADPQTRLILGAHIIGPQASTLLQQLVMAYQFGLTVDQVAKGQLWVHPALTEVVENCLLDL